LEHDFARNVTGVSPGTVNMSLSEDASQLPEFERLIKRHLEAECTLPNSLDEI
jgi:hypothetical protein